MQETDILRKVRAPKLSHTILRRQSLVTLLNDALLQSTTTRSPGNTTSYRVILFCAPSGYGKTTTLADFSHQAPAPCCWYELDQYDNDKMTFFSGFIASIHQIFPTSIPDPDLLLTQRTEQSNDEFINAMLTLLRQSIPEQFVFILTNLHEVNDNPTLMTLLHLLIEQLHGQCTLIIETRALPKLNLLPLLAYREVLGVGQDQLRFSPAELLALAQLRGNIPLTSQEAEHLVQTFDGWIAGILLGTRLGTRDLHFPRTSLISQTSQQPLLNHNHQHLFTYLVDEVFKHEPSVYSFLKEAVVIQQMEPTFCDTLLQRTDSAQTLAYLEQQGLFVTRSENAQKMLYTCHTVLRDTLLHALQTQHPERFLALNLRASELFHQSQEYKYALYHALRAHAYEQAVDLIVELYEREFKHGHTEAIEHWIQELPTSVLEQYPRLQIILANIYLSSGNVFTSTPLLQKVDALLSSTPPSTNEEEVLLRAELSLTWAKVYFFEGHYEQARERCQQTLSTIPYHAIALRAEAYLRLGMCDQTLGNFSTCIQELQQALRLLGYNIESFQTARLHSHLANTYGLLGNLPLSEHHRVRAIHCLDHLHDEHGKANNLTGMGVTFQRYGLYTDAERVLNESLQIARGPIKFSRAEAYALVSLGDVYLEQDKYEQALQALEDGLRLAYQLGDQYLLHYTHSILALNYLLMGDPHTALLLVSNTPLPTNPQARLSYGENLCALTHGTVLFAQHRYQEALKSLVRVEETLHADGHKRERLQVLIRLAHCYAMQQDAPRASHCFQEALSLAQNENYEVLARVEIQHMAHLLSHALSPELAHRHNHFLQILEGRKTSELDPSRDVTFETLPTLPAPAPILSPPSTATPNEEPSAAIPSGNRSIRILSLGEPTVLLDDQPVTRWRVTRVMELCFYLLDRVKPVHKEQIMLDLWPDTESSTEQSLRSIVYYLRKTLGERCISYQSGYYKLELAQVYGEQVEYDAALFEQYYKDGQQALENAETELAYQSFLQMVQLYRGDYLQSFYRDWCSNRRDTLRQLYIDARRQLATLTWQQETYQECASHWQHILDIDGCNEDAHYGLMCVYIKQGKRNLALRQYQRCASILHEELHVTPRQNIQLLYQRLTRKNNDA